MRIRLIPRSVAVFLLFLFVFISGGLVAYLWRSLGWLIAIPIGIVILGLLVAAIPATKRKVTMEQLARELESHLLGTEGKFDWDYVTSVAIVDERLERIRLQLSRFDSLSREEDAEELKALIAALRRGECPESSRG